MKVVIVIFLLLGLVLCHDAAEHRKVCVDAALSAMGDAADMVDVADLPVEYIDALVGHIGFFIRIRAVCEGVGAALGKAVVEGRVWASHTAHTGNETWTVHAHTLVPGLVTGIHTLYPQILIDSQRECVASSEDVEMLAVALRATIAEFYAELSDYGYGMRTVAAAHVEDLAVVDLLIKPLNALATSEKACPMPKAVHGALVSMMHGDLRLKKDVVTVQAIEHQTAEFMRQFEE